VLSCFLLLVVAVGSSYFNNNQRRVFQRLFYVWLMQSFAGWLWSNPQAEPHFFDLQLSVDKNCFGCSAWGLLSKRLVVVVYRNFSPTTTIEKRTKKRIRQVCFRLSPLPNADEL
jgi:hypothetical protein